MDDEERQRWRAERDRRAAEHPNAPWHWAKTWEDLDNCERFSRDYLVRSDLEAAASEVEKHSGGDTQRAEYDRQLLDYGLMSREHYDEIAEQGRYYGYVIQWLSSDRWYAEIDMEPDSEYLGLREWRAVRPRVERELDEIKRASDAGKRELKDREPEMIEALEKTRRAETERRRREQGDE